MRTHRLSDVAEQAGLSLATVDRVLHGRPGASPRAVRAVEQAVAELDRQAAALRLGASALVLDVVMQAPARFSDQVRSALESQLDALRPASVRARFRLREGGTVEDLLEDLDRVGRRGRTSHGVLLKAPDDPRVAAAVDRLAVRGIPVVTLVTDVSGCRRVAYVGPDNSSAGSTAGYLALRWSRRRRGTVLATLSRTWFAGERERVDAFVALLAREAPGVSVLEAGDADGLDATTGPAVAEALAGVTRLLAVYSAGGANRAVLGALAARGVAPDVFIAHDLDVDNSALLRTGAVDVVLHHDLRADTRSAVRQVLRHHGLVPGAPTSVRAGVQVVTPYNVPARMPRA